MPCYPEGPRCRPTATTGGTARRGGTLRGKLRPPPCDRSTATTGGTVARGGRCRNRRLRDERPVVAPVVLPVLARLERPPPVGVVHVPADRELQAFAQLDLRLPAQRGDARD